MRGLVLAVIALFLLSGDTGFSVPQLLRNAAQATNPAALLWSAAIQKSERAQQALVAYAAENDSTYWLNRLVKIGNADAAWVLYERAPPEADSSRLMRLAAMGNVPDAQQAYAMSVEDPEIRETWLLKAARQDYMPAQAALADWYLLQQQPENARPWLEKTADLDAQSAFKYGRLLWESGEHTAGKDYLEKAAAQGHDMAASLTRMIARYQPRTFSQITSRQWPDNKRCLQRIQIFATSLSTIQRADALYQRFQLDKRLEPLPICMQPPVWLQSDQLKCSDNWKRSGRLGCDIRPLSTAVKKRDFTHAVIVAKQGTANTHNGVMFLDISDAYSVFVHELAHFAGFADEYPLTKAAARRYCGREDIPNLVFDGILTYQPVTRVAQWQQLGSAGVWHAKTCESIGVNAYKPSRQVTFLEHHDSGVIPASYIRLWKAQLEDKSVHRPVYLNLFQSFHQGQQTADADEWLKRYESYREVPEVEAEAAISDVSP